MEKNVFGEELKVCCTSPMTGYFRDGNCRTISEDTGTHTVCAIMTDEFLDFSVFVEYENNVIDNYTYNASDYNFLDKDLKKNIKKNSPFYYFRE